MDSLLDPNWKKYGAKKETMLITVTSKSKTVEFMNRKMSRLVTCLGL